MRAIFTFLLVLASIRIAWSACDENLLYPTIRNDVLVIVNDNATDSSEVGCYYAQQRQLDKTNILHIKAPASYFIDWSQFQVVREQVFRSLINKISASDPSFVLASCAPLISNYCAATVAQIGSKTAITTLVTTWGVPSRVVDTPGDPLPSAFDDYLRMSLVNYVTGSTTFPAKDISVRRDQIEKTGYRSVNPAIDKELIIGRIDGVSADAAKQLVDRAVGVEANGFFGKAFWDIMNLPGYGAFDRRFNRWLYKPTIGNGYASESAYLTVGVNESSWRYILGVFDEQRDQCVGYSSFYLNGATKAPAECSAKLENAGHFGEPASHVQIIDNAILYLGNLDGQATYNESLPFATLLNWQRSAAIPDAPISCGLCQDAQCKAASTDAFKEIDTRCAGVAEGFVGYNYQSFPVSYLASWPTGWYLPEAYETELYSDSDGDDAYLAIPEVVADSHDAVGGALYFGHSKTNVAGANCYSDSSLSAQVPCVQKQEAIFGESLDLQPFNYAPNTEYQLTFWYKKTSNVTLQENNAIRVRVCMNAKDASGVYKQYQYGSMKDLSTGNDYLPIPASACINTWCQATFNLLLDPSIAGHTFADPTNPVFTSISYNGIKIIVNTNIVQGDILFDDFSLVKDPYGTPTSVVLKNPSFDAGHQQFSTGDYAATYLSRLNGTAFFGSMSHHITSGHSFDSTAGDSIVEMLRGMPLGEAVWLGNGGGGSGVLYGDPLYSPISVRIRPNVGAATLTNLHAGQLPLIIDALNGADSIKVATQYKIDVCHGSVNNPYADFFICNRDAAWTPTNISGSAGAKNIATTLNASGYANSVHTLRLTVTTTQLQSNKSQTFQSFLTFFGIGKFVTADGAYDTDGDGVDDETELYVSRTNPLQADTDGDGLSDGDELNVYHSDPLRVDTDGDGLNDGDEVHVFHSDPTKVDTDGDGHSDAQEAADGSSPTDPTNFKIHHIPLALWHTMVQ